MRLVTDAAWGIMTVWQEARGESHEGKIAVAEVILRRTAKKLFSNGTVAGTVLTPLHFSGWNAKDPNRVLAAMLDDSDIEVQRCVRAWAEAKTGTDLTKGATHYYNPKVVTPIWAATMKETAVIGNHRFMA